MHAIARKQLVEESRAKLARLRSVAVNLRVETVSRDGTEGDRSNQDRSVGDSTGNEDAENDRNLVRATQAELLAQRQAVVLAVLAELLEPVDLAHALDAFVGAVQVRVGAARVTLGLVGDDGAVKLGAISQQALVDIASDEVRLLLEVMEESLEHERTVCFPAQGTDSSLGVQAAHRTLGTRRERTALASVPLYHDATPVGVLLLERSDAEPIIGSTRELLEQIALMAAPPLALRREAERSALDRIRRTASTELERRFGSRRGGARVLLALAVVGAAVAALVPLPRDVGANAELVPRERRLVTAPFDSFVEAVSVEPGESVVAGQVLARLDRRELELERTQRDGEIDSAEAEFRAAMANHDRQATAVARARLDRERASRALVDQRLQRIELRAPIAGLVVSGDPADTVGAPVARGEALFEIAQAEGYEVHLMVHERDIREVWVGQRGTLSLRARPGDELQLQVHTIHPVAESVDGASRFRVRAALDMPEDVTPRPGESGVAQLETSRASLLSRITQTGAQRLTELWWRIAG